MARLGAPVSLHRSQSTATAHAAVSGQSVSYAYSDLRPHIVRVGNNGRLQPGGNYGNTREELAHVFQTDIQNTMANWKRPRVLLCAHGSLTNEESAVQRVAEYRSALPGHEI
jgi:hypothetical protein